MDYTLVSYTPSRFDDDELPPSCGYTYALLNQLADKMRLIVCQSIYDRYPLINLSHFKREATVLLGVDSNNFDLNMKELNQLFALCSTIGEFTLTFKFSQCSDSDYSELHKFLSKYWRRIKTIWFKIDDTHYEDPTIDVNKFLGLKSLIDRENYIDYCGNSGKWKRFLHRSKSEYEHDLTQEDRISQILDISSFGFWDIYEYLNIPKDLKHLRLHNFNFGIPKRLLIGNLQQLHLTQIVDTSETILALLRKSPDLKVLIFTEVRDFDGKPIEFNFQPVEDVRIRSIEKYCSYYNIELHRNDIFLEEFL